MKQSLTSLDQKATALGCTFETESRQGSDYVTTRIKDEFGYTSRLTFSKATQPQEEFIKKELILNYKVDNNIVDHSKEGRNE